MSFSPAWFPPPSRRLPLGLAMGGAVLLHLLVIVLFLHAPAPTREPLPRPMPILLLDLAQRPEALPPERPDMLGEAHRQAETTSAPEPPPLVKTPAPPPVASSPPPAPAPSAPPKGRSPQAKPATVTEGPKPPAAPKAAPQQSLAERSLRMDRLRASIDEQNLRNEIANRSAVLTANTTYGPEAAYLRAWVEKVERVGNLNFPDAARRQKLSGRLILEVSLDDQGRVQAMRVRHPSGEPVLDAAAQDIVRLASPFAPFPAELRVKYDQLTIIRTWVFESGRGLSTR